MKSQYENPVMETIELGDQDVILTSGVENGGGNTESGWGPIS